LLQFLPKIAMFAKENPPFFQPSAPKPKRVPLQFITANDEAQMGGEYIDPLPRVFPQGPPVHQTPHFDSTSLSDLEGHLHKAIEPAAWGDSRGFPESRQ